MVMKLKQWSLCGIYLFFYCGQKELRCAMRNLNAPYTVFLLVKHPILGITDVMGIMQPVINDHRFVYTDVAMNGVLSRWEPSRMKISCCYFKLKNVKNLCALLQNLVHVPYVLFLITLPNLFLYQWMKTNGSASVRRITLNL